MKSQDKKTAEHVETLKEKAARLREEAAKAEQEASLAEEEHAIAEEEHVIENSREAPNISEELLTGDARADFDNSRIEQYMPLIKDFLTRMLVILGHISLTPAERRRLLGSGVRRLGFIEKITDMAALRPEFIPPFFNLARMQTMARSIELLRNIRTLAEAIDRMSSDALLIVGNESFQQALMYYNSVRDAARRGVPTAQDMLNSLDLLFRRGRQGDEEPTVEETLRDAKALLHGKKDGKIVIEGHAKHTTAAEHAVVDDVHKPQNADFKEVIHGTICTECKANNPEHAKFCINCGAKL